MGTLNRIQRDIKDKKKQIPINRKTMINSPLDSLKKKDIPDAIKESLGLVLSPEENIFVTEYSNTLDLENSYKKAFYPDKLMPLNVIQSASLQLMKLPHIQNAIKKQLAARMEKINMNGDKILAEISYIAFSNIKDIFTNLNVLKNIHEMPDTVTRAIQTYEIDARGNVKVRFYDKHKALQELGLYLGLFDPDRNKDMDETARKVRNAISEMRKLTVGEN